MLVSAIGYFFNARVKEITKFRSTASEQLQYWIRDPLVSDIADLRKLVRDEEYPKALNLCITLNTRLKTTQNHYPYFEHTKEREFNVLQTFITAISNDLVSIDTKTEAKPLSTMVSPDTKASQLTRMLDNIEAFSNGFQTLVTELYKDIHQTDLIYTGYFPANPIPLSEAVPQPSNLNFSLRQIMLGLFGGGLIIYPILNQLIFKEFIFANALLFLIGGLVLWRIYKKPTKI